MIDNHIDLIHKLSYSPNKRLTIFNDLSIELKSRILLKLSKRIKLDILNKLNDEEIVNILEQLDLDEATDIVQLLSRNRQSKVINKLNLSLKKDVENLLQFDPQTAAGLMNIDYINVEITDTAEEVSTQIKIHESRTSKIPTILVVQDGKLMGYLPVYIIGLVKPSDKIGPYIEQIEVVKHDVNFREIIPQITKNNSNRLVVLGKNDNIIGVVYAIDILKAVRLNSSNSLYNFAGLNDEETVYDSFSNKVNSRYKWLIINLMTAFLASFTISLFDETISKYVILAVYMPIVAGMGGNAATQTLAVMVRGITLKQIDLHNFLPMLKMEVISGLINGLINGIIVAIIVILTTSDWKVAIILTIAMIANLVVAAISGTTIPLIMKKFGKDPANSATVFITTATDVLGFLAFLGLATLVLG